MGSKPRKLRSQHGNRKTNRGHPSSLLARAATRIVYVRASSSITPPQSVRKVACASASAFVSVYTCRANVQHKCKGTHTQREGRVCVRAVHGSLSLTLTRPPPQQPHTQEEEEAKKGRWCGRPRCCCPCRQSSPLQFSWLRPSLVLPSDWHLYFHFVFLFVSLHHQLLNDCSACALQCYCQLHYWRHHRLPWVMVALILHGRQMVHCIDWLRWRQRCLFVNCCLSPFRFGLLLAVPRPLKPQNWTVYSVLLLLFVFVCVWPNFHLYL
ncbi:hypothetical protein TcCL_Unassigned04019 [Trypanosoma cruzi]|nr:hypothetical protein TcCL_Unassigned04019 [Trypanosoma cruzi]